MPNKKVKVEECTRLTIYPLIKTLKRNLPTIISLDDRDNIGISLQIDKRSRSVLLYYTQANGTEEEKNLQYSVRLTRTRCHISGFRCWFTCPLLQDNEKVCGRRVGVLYKPPDEDYFGCRHCHNLTYKSRNTRCLKTINIFEAQEQYRNLKRKFYRGLPTRRHLALLDRFGKSREATEKRVIAMNERLRKKYHLAK